MKSNIPQLRFPEFADCGEWDFVELKDVSVHITDKVGEQKLEPLSISAGVGFVEQSKKFGRDISGKQYKNYIVINQYDFSYNKGNSKKYPEGCIYYLKEYDKAAVPNAFVTFRLKDKNALEFYQKLFEINMHGKELKKHITSGARSDGLLNISAANFFSIKLPHTSYPEQQKIADCLSSLDTLINAQSEKVEKLKSHKKGLLQKLFPQEGQNLPEFRFPEFKDCDEWEEKEFLDIFQNIPAKSFQVQTSEYNKSGKFPIIDQGQKQIAGYNDTIEKLFKNIPIIIYGDHTTIVKYAISPFIIGGDGVQLLNAKKDNLLFCFFLLDRYNIKPDGYKRHYSILKTKKFSLSVIPEEQQKIAGCLSSLDELIDKHCQKLEALKAHKKGLMQGLFPCE